MVRWAVKGMAGVWPHSRAKEEATDRTRQRPSRQTAWRQEREQPRMAEMCLGRGPRLRQVGKICSEGWGLP